MLEKTGQMEQGLEQVAILLREDPGDLRLRLARARLLERAGRQREALEAYRTVLLLDRFHPQAQVKERELSRSVEILP